MVLQPPIGSYEQKFQQEECYHMASYDEQTKIPALRSPGFLL